MSERVVPEDLSGNPIVVDDGATPGGTAGLQISGVDSGGLSRRPRINADGLLDAAPPAKLSTANSTDTPATTFTGTYEDVLQYAQVQIYLVASHYTTIAAYWSTDGVTDDSSESLSFESPDFHRFWVLPPKARYFKLVAEQDSPATVLKIQTVLRKEPVTELSAIGSSGASNGVPVMGQYDENNLFVPGGNTVAPVRITVNRALHANLRSATGVEQGTAAAPLRVNPTGTTAQPVTDNGGSLTVDTPQLPAALVSGKLDVRVGEIAVSLPSGGNNIGSVNVAALPVNTIAATLPKLFDLDTTGGSDPVMGVALALPSAVGAVVGGTASGPIRTDPTGTTTQPVSAASLPLPTGAAQEHVTAGSPSSVRLSDGSAFYVTPERTQLPAALSGGRLDVVVGAALPAGTNNIGDVDLASAIPTGDNAIGRVKLTDGTDVADVVDVDGEKGVAIYQPKPASYYAYFDRIVPAANKYMASLFNPDNTNLYEVVRILCINAQVAAVTGVLLEQYLAFITARTAGTGVTSQPYDSADGADGAITAETNITAVTERDIRKRFWTTNEEMAAGVLAATGLTLEIASNREYQTIFEVNDRLKPIVLRANEGVAIRNVTSSTVGSCSYLIEYTKK